MKRLNKGPEINFSKLKSGDVKPPKAVGDLYRELKSQHLLPIVVLLVIGLVAVPVLIGSSSDKSPEVAAQGTIKGASTEQAALKVTRWTPGLLDYKKTLRGAHPVNPFSPKASASEESGSKSGEVQSAPPPAEIEVETEGGSEPGGATNEAPVEPTEEGGGEETGGHGEESGHEESGAITIDVQVTTVHQEGGVDRAPVRRDLPQLTKLPSESTPALTYVGPSDDGTKAMMSVSAEVTAMIGDSKCVVHANPCSLLALQVGAPETLVFGPRGLTYRIELVRVGEHTNSPGTPGPKRSTPKGVKGAGTEPAPRGEASSLIGLGSLRVVQRPFGL